MRSNIVIITIGLLLFTAQGFYEDDDTKVINLTEDNFKQLVIETEDLWMVEFYAPWCGHCKSLAPEYKKAAKALEGIVKLGAVDMTTQGDAGAPYDVSSYPTIKFFGQDKQNPVPYDGERKKRGIIDYSLDQAKKLAFSRIGIETSSSSSSTETNDDVHVITEQNFEQLVLQSTDPWFIEFYAPWCKHCKKLEPIWAKLATKYKGSLKMGKVDATTETELAEKYKVEGFPSLKYFSSGIKNQDSLEEYGGDREQSDLVNFIKKKLSGTSTKKENLFPLDQLADQATYNTKCNNDKLCMITFLQPLSEISGDARQNQIQLIKDVASTVNVKNINYLWSNGGDFEEFESEVNVLGFDYPATFIIDSKNKKFYLARGGFSLSELVNFIQGVTSGNQKGFDYTDFPTLKRTKRNDDL